jgi:hypothetical protein
MAPRRGRLARNREGDGRGGMAWSLGGEDGGVGPLELPMCGLELKELRIKAMRCTRLDKRCSGDLRSISSKTIFTSSGKDKKDSGFRGSGFGIIDVKPRT